MNEPPCLYKINEMVLHTCTCIKKIQCIFKPIFCNPQKRKDCNRSTKPFNVLKMIDMHLGLV